VIKISETGILGLTEIRCIVFPVSRLGDQIKKNEMDRAYGTFGGQERCIHGFGAGDPREDVGIDGRIILK
jgi:hypothetical protein